MNTTESGIVCKTCETQNAPGARFCSSCGNPMASGLNSVLIQSGANSEPIDLAENESLTVAQVRERLGDILNIAPTAIAVIGEEKVAEDRELVPGETLQFIKESGTKG